MNSTKCQTCNGTGKVKKESMKRGRLITSDEICPQCKGENLSQKKEKKNVTLSERIKGTLLFKKDIILSIKDNKKLNNEALLILGVIVITTILSEIFVTLYDYFYTETSIESEIRLIQLLLGIIIFHIGGSFVFLSTCIFIGSLIINQKDQETQLAIFRPLCYAYFPNIFKMIPSTIGIGILEPIFRLWWIAATTFTLMVSLDKKLNISLAIVIASLLTWIVFIQIVGIIIFTDS